MGDFGQSAKGGPFAKIVNTSRKLVWMDAEFILVSI